MKKLTVGLVLIMFLVGCEEKDSPPQKGYAIQYKIISLTGRPDFVLGEGLRYDGMRYILIRPEIFISTNHCSIGDTVFARQCTLGGREIFADVRASSSEIWDQFKK